MKKSLTNYSNNNIRTMKSQSSDNKDLSKKEISKQPRIFFRKSHRRSFIINQNHVRNDQQQLLTSKILSSREIMDSTQIQSSALKKRRLQYHKHQRQLFLTEEKIFKERNKQTRDKQIVFDNLNKTQNFNSKLNDQVIITKHDIPQVNQQRSHLNDKIDSRKEPEVIPIINLVTSEEKGERNIQIPNQKSYSPSRIRKQMKRRINKQKQNEMNEEQNSILRLSKRLDFNENEQIESPLRKSKIRFPFFDSDLKQISNVVPAQAVVSNNDFLGSDRKDLEEIFSSLTESEIKRVKNKNSLDSNKESLKILEIIKVKGTKFKVATVQFASENKLKINYILTTEIIDSQPQLLVDFYESLLEDQFKEIEIPI